MKTLMSFALALFVFVAVAPARADAPSVRAWLDRDTMHMGETVTLNVEAAGDTGGQPDFSALSADFNLLGTQSSQQVSIVNGASTTKVVWAVGLDPSAVPAPREGHFGLRGMSERAASLSGRLTVRSRRGEGTTVEVDVPLKRAS